MSVNFKFFKNSIPNFLFYNYILELVFNIILVLYYVNFHFDSIIPYLTVNKYKNYFFQIKYLKNGKKYKF